MLKAVGAVIATTDSDQLFMSWWGTGFTLGEKPQNSI